MLPDPHLPDFLTSLVDTSFREKLDVLDAIQLSDRYTLALSLLQRQISVSGGGGACIQGEEVNGVIIIMQMLKASENSSELKERGREKVSWWRGMLLTQHYAVWACRECFWFGRVKVGGEVGVAPCRGQRRMRNYQNWSSV